LDTTIKIWDYSKEITLKTLIGHTGGAFSLVVLPDGSLASGSTNGEIRICAYSIENTLKTLTGHTSYILFLVV